MIEAGREFRWFELAHIEVEEREIHQKKSQLDGLSLPEFIVLPKKVVEEVLKRVVDETEIQKMQDLGFNPNYFLVVDASNPICELRRVYLFVLHCDEQTGLRHIDSLHLIFNIAAAREVHIHVLNSKVKSGPFETHFPINFEDMPYQVAPHLEGQNLVFSEVAIIDS